MNPLSSDISQTVDSRFSDTEYLVKVEGNEHYFLWLQNEKEKNIKNWKEDNKGTFLTIGHLDYPNPRPIVLSLFWDKLDGVRVCFYSCNSQLVDWKMIDEWFENNFNPMTKENRRAHCNAMNFGHCIGHIRSKNESV